MWHDPHLICVVETCYNYENTVEEEKMKPPRLSILFILGVLFFIQAGIIATRFPSGETRTDVESTKQHVRELCISQWVTSLSGSLAGCLGCWLLALHLRTRKLEREIKIRFGATAIAADEQQSARPKQDEHTFGQP
jgi:hypothetical protein